MTRTEAVERAELLFDFAYEGTRLGGKLPRIDRVQRDAAIALGNSYLALARLADD